MDPKDYYNSISKGYEELHKLEQKRKIEIIRQHIKPLKTDKLLDVGCGSGIATVVWDCDVYGLDPSENLLEIAKKKNPQIKWIYGAAENMPFENNFFDIVISVTAIQNFSDLEKGLWEIKRVGKKKFALTFLKASLRKCEIKKAIEKYFHITLEIEEEKDLIFICL